MHATSRPALAVIVAAILTAVSMTGSLLAGPAAAAPITTPSTPGTVLSQTALPASALPSNVARGYRLLYVTQDQSGRPVTSTGALYLPAGKAPAGGWPVMSWAHGTSGISDACSPSSRPGSYRDFYEPSLSVAMRAGYAVTASDYPGLGSGGRAEYLGGRAEGRAVIDMIRAARAVDPSLSRRWVSTGHSQGGHSALWAAQLAPHYAPELPLMGTVAYAPASNLEGVIPMMLPGVPDLGPFNGLTGLVLYILDGLDHARPDVDVPSYLTPLGREWLVRARGVCVFNLRTALGSVGPGSLIAKPMTDPRFTAALKDYLGVPAGGYSAPIRIEQGISDTTVPLPLSVALDAQMRSAGTNVELRTYPGADHQGVQRAAQQDAFDTIAAYFRR